MAGFITRDLTITYAGQALGGSSQIYLIDGGFNLDKSYEAATLSWKVRVVGTTDANFKTRKDALEDAMRKPDQDLTLVWGAATLISWSQSSDTGMNSVGTCEQDPEDPANQGYCAVYNCQVEVQLPSDLTGRAGRRTGDVDVQTSPSGRRTLTVSGEWTALSGTAARSQFESNIDAYVSSITTALTGTWELTEKSSEQTDQNDKVISYTRTYKEIKYNQSSSGADDARLVDPTISFVRRLESPGDAQDASQETAGFTARLAEITIQYDSSVAFAQTTDLYGAWNDVVKPYILEQALSKFEAAGGALLSEETTRYACP